MSRERIRTFGEFWPYYVRQHSRSGTRLMHSIGSALALVLVGCGFAVSPWFFLAAPVVGYSFAWFSHFRIERNRPATFGHPLYSLAADYRMVFLMMAGRMEGEVAKYVVSQGLPPQDRKPPSRSPSSQSAEGSESLRAG